MSDAVSVLLLDGQLGALAWSFAQAAPSARLGVICVDGAGRPERASMLAVLRGRGLIAGELTAGAPGGSGEALSAAEALDRGFGDLSFDAAVCLAGICMDGQSDPALECAGAASARECDTVLVAQIRSTLADQHQMLSERTLALLDELAEPVTVALPAGIRSPVGRELREGLRSVFDSSARQSQLALGVDRPARIARHDWRRAPVDLVGFAGARVPALDSAAPLLVQPLLYASALAAGSVLAELLHEEEWQ
ncbi:MAG TPA: DUF3866 family protein [Solirubrobacteraceae bacterium]|nr:DUF3866 family protein [Solirubrobacteraceae bacterium]